MSGKKVKKLITKDKNKNFNSIDDKDELLYNKILNYDLNSYIKDIDEIGLEETWNNICDYVLNKGKFNKFLNVKNFGEMYEIGLAIVDKIKKKNSGQYYTPDDVALIMSKWLYKCEGDNVCDVGCGTGKLILTYLDYIGKEKATKLLSDGKLYLYDCDKVALKICKTSLLLKYGIEFNDKIHDIKCDFLDKDIILPFDSKTISNPPYAKIKEFSDNWNKTDVIYDTQELYSAFMEKIFEQSKSTVIITPFSFISGNKFYSLRKKMCNLGNGFIVAFDNVPGNIFCGRKQGIFNTNTANSVRAAITVLNKSDEIKGFKVSPLIRFKNEERKKLLKTSVLESTINNEFQIVNNENKAFEKVSKKLKRIYKKWTKKSTYIVKDLLSVSDTKYIIYVPNTCRYNTTGSSRKLNRGGLITLYFDDEYQFYFMYCFINSSFAYWWWRIFDGGITYPVNLLYHMPIPYNLLDDNDKKEFKELALEMMEKENEYITTKMNAGMIQENIKFPKNYRDTINNKILTILGIAQNSEIFDMVHSNGFFVEGEEDDSIR